MSLIKYIADWIKDPIGTVAIKRAIANVHEDMRSNRCDLKSSLKDIKAGTEVFEDVIRQYQEAYAEQEVELMAHRLGVDKLMESNPLMMWIKRKDGRYIWANRKIREGLLFTDSLETTIGRTDMELGAKAVNKFGSKWHSFGIYCYDSDKITIEARKEMTFLEFGFSGGKPLILDVSKHCLFSESDGELFATSGSAKDITDRILVVLKVHSQTTCEDTVKELESMINKIVFTRTGEEVELYNWYKEEVIPWIKHKETGNE